MIQSYLSEQKGKLLVKCKDFCSFKSTKDKYTAKKGNLILKLNRMSLQVCAGCVNLLEGGKPAAFSYISFLKLKNRFVSHFLDNLRVLFSKSVPQSYFVGLKTKSKFLSLHKKKFYGYFGKSNS